MMAADIARVFEEIAPQSIGIEGDQLGFIYGDPETVVTGVGCLWCAHTRSLHYCVNHKPEHSHHPRPCYICPAVISIGIRFDSEGNAKRIIPCIILKIGNVPGRL